jgi:glycosyltransferase involved in cell wall biosynthesis
MPKILFIGHSASRTGAPIILLNLLQWLRGNTADEFDLYVTETGPLLADFRAIAKTEVLRREPSLGGRLVRRLVGHGRWEVMHDRAFADQVRSRGYQVAYVNTIAPKREIVALTHTRIPVICHVHELDFSMRYWLGKDGLAPLIPGIAHFIAASVAVRDHLVDHWGVAESKVSVVHEFISLEQGLVDRRDARRRVRESLGLSDDDILVGNCGTLDWRKGADLFLQAARVVAAHSRARKIRFLWVGADLTSLDYWKFNQDAALAGVREQITVVESTSRPLDFFAAMDIFALSSREDPFPLVMLEAASMSLPLVCFDSSGGGPEFVEHDAGLIAPYLDVGAFATHILALADDAMARSRLGANGRRKLLEHYTLEQQVPKLYDVITALAGK